MKRLTLILLSFILISCSGTEKPKYYPDQKNQIIGIVEGIVTSANKNGTLIFVVKISGQDVNEIITVTPDKEALLFVDEMQQIRPATLLEITISDRIILYQKPSVSADMYPRNILVDEIIIIR